MKQMRLPLTTQFGKRLKSRPEDGTSRRKSAVTLLEILCVIAIILILASFYLPAILKAYQRVRAFLSGM